MTRAPRLGGLILLCTLVLGACNGPLPGQGNDPVLVARPADVEPGASPGAKAVLVIAGTRVPVEVVHRREGNQVLLLLNRHGQTFEREVYEETEKFFRLIEAADDRFVPGVDLLRFGDEAGLTWEWQGQIVTAGISKPASATVTASSSKVFVESVPVSAVQSVVLLKIRADANLPPIERKLTFWFGKGKGVLKREFGESYSVREPASD